MRTRMLLVLCAALALSAGVATATAGGGNSGNAEMCKKDGWKSLVGAEGTTFKNQGSCVSYAVQGGGFATGLIIPAGHTATLAHAHPCAIDKMTYGYQLNFGANVVLGSDYNTGNFCSADEPGTPAVVGPFATATVLRVFLSDLGTPPSVTCDYTYYSDGSHAASVGSNPTLIGINDSGLCTSPPSSPRPPTTIIFSDFTIEVTIS
jgi:hypothetical protein